MSSADYLYIELSNALKEDDWDDVTSVPPEAVSAMADDLRDAAEEILEESGGRRFDACKMLAVFARHIQDMRDEPEEGWPLHCYRYVRNLLFPHLEGPSDPERYSTGRSMALRLLRGAYEYERRYMRFDPTKDFAMLSDEEVLGEGFTTEYIKLRGFLKDMYIYEFMRLGADITPFDTIGHVAGVHYVATYVGRQLRDSGVPVDLALLSGAAASHDIGKYGCRKSEERRVPYLHYYYTDYCMNRFGMPAIGHIGANHSTWDLEFENLSAESLLVIYADFRVKSSRGEDGKEVIHFYTLTEAFDVILGKLDNVDEAKKHRYEKVYNKLKDFEDYMIDRGVQTDMPDLFCLQDGVITALPETGAGYRETKPVPVQKEIALLHGDDVVTQMKFKSVDHNLRLMNHFNSQNDFADLLEAARSESNWLDQRTYITIFGEYSKYMTVDQKELTLKFLYEKLTNRASDIREQAAVQMGEIIADFRESYKKELPEDIPQPDVAQTNVARFEYYLDLFIYPSNKLIEQHQRNIIQSTDFFVRSVITSCRAQYRDRYFDVLAAFYDIDRHVEIQVLSMLNAALMLDPDVCTEDFVRAATCYANAAIGKYSGTVDFLAYDVLEHFMGDADGKIMQKRRKAMKVEGTTAPPEEIMETMFLDNLKFQTGWTDKIANIRYMMETADGNDSNDVLHIATHLANLIKVSETVTVRKKAGQALLDLTDRMPVDQLNEIMTELRSGLEIEDYQFSRFIPEFLGKLILCLPPEEYDEAIDDLVKLVYRGSSKTASAALITISIALENIAAEHDINEGENAKRANRLTGLLMKGAAHYDPSISQETLHTVGLHIFNSEILSLEKKRDIASHMLKRLISLIPDDGKERSPLEFYNNAAVLNMIYRFIAEYQSEVGKFGLTYTDKVAFFPGTFDPFSLSHKKIARTIRDMGFEVYLAIDEFSWSKKTLPHMFRRDILSMSIADEEGLYIFPDNIPVNIANEDDLANLKALFADRELYIAVGSDVIRNATCYKKEPAENSIHSINHICFARETVATDGVLDKSYPVRAKLIELELPKFYEDISSTRIRENIDLGRDISNLVDPVAQGYIYSNNFYTREPAYKYELMARDITISDFARFNFKAVEPLRDTLVRKGYNYDALYEYMSRPHVRTVYIERGEERKVMAFASSRRVERQDLLAEFGNSELTAAIRKNATGAIGVIGAFYADDRVEESGEIINYNQVILTELMSSLIAKDYGYVIYHPVSKAGMTPEIIEVLRRQGFVNIAGEGQEAVYAVDTTSPIVIFKDVETVIKAPLNKNPRVQRAIEDAHNRMLETMSGLFPGKLILSFNTGAVYSKIMELVARENGVQNTPDPKKRRGPYMAVPFGKALADVVAPNTVTKALRTEKYFNTHLTSFRIGEADGYLGLDDQARMLKSFNRPAILIDDLLHSGMRMQKIDIVLRENDIDVRKVIVGVLTGNAMDTMTERSREVEGAYFLPSIRMWVNEKDCYPFIGGDSIDKNAGGYSRVRGSSGNASINMILPYAYPNYVGDRDKKEYDMFRVFAHSMTCLENARDIMKVLEEEYQAEFEKQLTIERLGAVITQPRKPAVSDGLKYDGTIPASTYIQGDIDQAERLRLVHSSTKMNI